MCDCNRGCGILGGLGCGGNEWIIIIVLILIFCPGIFGGCGCDRC